MTRARHWAILLLAAGLVLALASGLAACNGSADDEPPPAAAETAPQTAMPVAEPPPAETPPPPTTSPDTPVPEPPAEPAAPAASPPPAESAISAAEPVAAPGEPSPPAAESPEPAPLSFRYDTYDRSGAVAEPGHYAFLADPADPASVVTTYEGLRDGSVMALRIHTHDAHGVPQADLYDAVEAGDLVEWKQADDCFVRYQVTEVPEPAADAVSRTIGVAWMTYAFTGCSGPIAGDTAATFEWGDLPDLGGTSLTAPIIHGDLYQLVPEGWTGATEEPRVVELSEALLAKLNAEAQLPVAMTEAAAARYTYWRAATLPPGWSFYKALINFTGAGGLQALYRSPSGGIGLEIDMIPPTGRRFPDVAAWRTEAGLGVAETRVIAGRPAHVIYSPLGPEHDDLSPVTVWLYDPDTGGHYILYAGNRTLMGANIDPMIAIATSLFEPPNPP